MSSTDRSKWNGAWLEKRSSARASTSATDQSMKASAARWLMQTPLGRPVEPDVYRMNARSSASPSLARRG